MLLEALPPMRHRAGAWRDVSCSGRPAPQRLRLLTLNTWFHADDRARRLAAQLSTFERLRPDILALQEVTADLLLLLERSAWLRDEFAIPPASCRRRCIEGYGTFLAVRPEIHAYSWCTFEGSEMGRGLLQAAFSCGTRVGTVHLESLSGFATERARQLATCTDVLTSGPPSLLLGDFNFDDTEPDAPHLAPWTDLWPVRNPHDPGFTVDSRRNPYRRRRGMVQRRIDRVLLYDPTSRWTVARMERIGTEPTGDGVHLSDHFGLMVDLEQRPSPTPSPSSRSGSLRPGGGGGS